MRLHRLNHAPRPHARRLSPLVLSLGLAGGVAAAAVGCSADDGGCTKDNDCATGRICGIEGRCVDLGGNTTNATGAGTATSTTSGAGGGSSGATSTSTSATTSTTATSSTTSTSAVTSTGTGGSAPMCGDGKVEATEECDDGSGNLLCSGCEACTKQHVLDLPAKAYVKSSAAKSALPPLTSDACYEAWGKTDGSVKDALYFASVSSNTSINVILRCLSGNAVFAVQNGPNSVIDLATGASCGDNQWHHVAGCRDVDGSSVTLTLYVDGKLVGSKSGSTASIAPPADVYLGGVSYGQDGLAGSIDEVRVSKSLRYTGNFVPQRHFASDANTTLLWHFDEGSGTSVADASGNGYSGTVVGGAFSPDTGYRPEFCKAN